MLFIFFILTLAAPNRFLSNVKQFFKNLGVSKITANEPCIGASSNTNGGTCELYPQNNNIELPVDVPNCLICLEELNINCGDLAVCARCPQKYHPDCKATWSAEGINGKTCPSCKMLWPEFTVEIMKGQGLESLNSLEKEIPRFVNFMKTIRPIPNQMVDQVFLNAILEVIVSFKFLEFTVLEVEKANQIALESFTTEKKFNSYQKRLEKLKKILAKTWINGVSRAVHVEFVQAPSAVEG